MMADETTAFFRVEGTLWAELVQSLREVEVDEVKRILGYNLVENNEDLYKEAVALHEIFMDFQEQTSNMKDDLARRPKLPEPPGRALLEGQIRLFIGNLRARERASKPSSGGRRRSRDSSIPISTPRDQDVYDYVVNGCTPRPQSARSRPNSSPGKSRSVTPRPGSSCGSTSSAPDTLVPLQDYLNVNEIEKVAGSLRQAMKGETERLKEDIEYITSCLEAHNEEHVEVEAEAEGRAPPRKPSVHDLREFSAKLEQEWLKGDTAALARHPPDAAQQAPHHPMRRSSSGRVLPSLRPVTPNRPPLPPAFGAAVPPLPLGSAGLTPSSFNHHAVLPPRTAAAAANSDAGVRTPRRSRDASSSATATAAASSATAAAAASVAAAAFAGPGSAHTPGPSSARSDSSQRRQSSSRRRRPGSSSRRERRSGGRGVGEGKGSAAGGRREEGSSSRPPHRGSSKRRSKRHTPHPPPPKSGGRGAAASHATDITTGEASQSSGSGSEQSSAREAVGGSCLGDVGFGLGLVTPHDQSGQDGGASVRRLRTAVHSSRDDIFF